MNTHTLARRPMRRYASRRKAVLNMDLNAPSAETQTNRGTSNHVHSQASHGASASTNSRQGSRMPANDGSRSFPIDVEAIDDDVLIISSSSGFPQTRQSRRSPVIVVLDDDLEDRSTKPGVAAEDSVSTFSLNSHEKRVRIPPNTGIIDCDVCSADGDNPKRKRVVSSRVEPEKVVPNKVTCTCPVCLDTMTEPCSTICGHVFCQRCIKASIQAQKKCPTCRRKLTINKFHRVYLPTTTN